MKKMKMELAQDIFNRVAETNNEYTTVKFTIGLDEFTCEMPTYLSIADAVNISKEIIFATYIDGTCNDTYYELYFAKNVIEYLTNIPVPTIKDDEDKEVIDLQGCHRLFMFLQQSIDLPQSVDTLNTIARRIIAMQELAALSPSEQLCQKIVKVWDSTETYLDDLVNNPATMEELTAMLFEQLKPYTGELLDGENIELDKFNNIIAEMTKKKE
jgi:hypothetical protein